MRLLVYSNVYLLEAKLGNVPHNSDSGNYLLSANVSHGRGLKIIFENDKCVTTQGVFKKIGHPMKRSLHIIHCELKITCVFIENSN